MAVRDNPPELESLQTNLKTKVDIILYQDNVDVILYQHFNLRIFSLPSLHSTLSQGSSFGLTVYSQNTALYLPTVQRLDHG